MVQANNPSSDSPPAPETAAPAADPAARVVELETKIAELNDRMLRALAEADNIRKRAEKERADTAKFAVASFARELLGVADNLRRALTAFPEGDRESNVGIKNLYAGIEATERGMLKAFENIGIKKIEAIGQPFNPNFHEVMFETDMPDKPAGTVIQIIDPGYMIHERLLRPARVGISKGGASLQSGKQLDEQA